MASGRHWFWLGCQFYHDPQIRVDEATSALDNETERYVMEAIQEVATTRMVVLIAHRLEHIPFNAVIEFSIWNKGG